MRQSLVLASLATLASQLVESRAWEHPLARAQSSNQVTISHEPVEAVWDAATGELADHASAIIRSRWQSAPASDVRDKRQRGLIGDIVSGLLQHDEGWGIAVAKTENESQDNEWLVEAAFGTPPQRLKVVIDTGSPDAWTYSPQCCYASNHSHFDPRRSSTFSNRTVVDGVQARAPKGEPGTVWNITYGSGSTTSGYLGIDTVSFANGRLSVDNVTTALATAVTGSSRASRKLDGIIGVQPSKVQLPYYPGGVNNPFEQAVREKKLDKPYLTATFVKANRQTGRGGGGRYTFGSLDYAATRGEMTWVNTSSANFWGLSYDGVRVGSTDISTSSDPFRRMIVDTGSALNLFNPTIADAINAQIYGSLKRNSGGSGNSAASTSSPWLVPCDTGLTRYELMLPREKRNQPWYVTLGGRSFGVPVQDFVFWPLQPVPKASYNGSASSPDMCISAFQPTTAAFAVLGDVFLKNHVVTFDTGVPGANYTFAGRRIGFGDRVDVIVA
ncbi:unnamed protein product [Parajaminaea phylloscopi]